MRALRAGLWIWGAGSLELRLEAPDAIEAQIRSSGSRSERVLVAGEATVRLELREPEWHFVLLEVPKLLATDPPRGLELAELSLHPGARGG